MLGSARNLIFLDYCNSRVLAVQESELDERVLQMGMEIRWEAQCRVAGSITAGIAPQTFGNVTSPIKNRSAGLLGGGRSAWCSCPYPQLQCDHPFPSSVKSSSRHL
ncbi:hypothetical protein OPV22_019161 [Ensete ventricosum]|uniref:Uncharacterized protein n=1 Tax=Ensete ventricosum TaxID=4639 RepID=A0AAV8QX85_ENSVE|nr:hypothetical protein OPV22_019161 [Ensete ventricosum]